MFFFFSKCMKFLTRSIGLSNRITNSPDHRLASRKFLSFWPGSRTFPITDCHLDHCMERWNERIGMRKWSVSYQPPGKQTTDSCTHFFAKLSFASHSYFELPQGGNCPEYDFASFSIDFPIEILSIGQSIETFIFLHFRDKVLQTLHPEFECCCRLRAFSRTLQLHSLMHQQEISLAMGIALAKNVLCWYRGYQIGSLGPPLSPISEREALAFRTGSRTVPITDLHLENSCPFDPDHEHSRSPTVIWTIVWKGETNALGWGSDQSHISHLLKKLWFYWEEIALSVVLC